MQSRTAFNSLPVVLGVLLFVTGCGRSSAPSPVSLPTQAAVQKDSPFEVTATLRELMDSTVDPSADGLWNSVAIIYTPKTTENRQPRTDEEWLAVRRHAITLIEATNLIVMDGRHAAPAGTQSGEGELAPEEIDRRIAANRGVFVQFARTLREQSLQALQAIDRKDASTLLEVGSTIDEVCEACHVTFWYPNQSTGGIR